MDPVTCPHCNRSCAGPAGLASHIRSMHPEVIRAAEARLSRDLSEPSPDGIVWEEPPTAIGRRSVHVPAILAQVPQLRRNPGRWAKLRTFTSKSSAGSFKKQLVKLADVADIEFSANAVDGGSALYGRYVETD